MRYSFANCPGNEALEKTRGNLWAMLFVGRSGTTFVIDVFNQHPQVKFEGEWLATFKDMDDSSVLQTAWIGNVYSPENLSTFEAVGFKTKLWDVPDRDAFRRSLEEFRPTVLLSQRRNVVKQAISAIRIKRLADLKKQEMGREKWQHSRTANQVWNIYQKGEGIGRMRLDVLEVNGWARHLEKSARELDDFVDSLDLDIVSFDYDDIISDAPLFFGKMFHLLGVEPISYKTNVLKHTPDDLSEVVENIEELQDFFAGTHLEPFVV